LRYAGFDKALSAFEPVDYISPIESEIPMSLPTAAGPEGVAAAAMAAVVAVVAFPV
jgi:hypothetical protein